MLNFYGRRSPRNTKLSELKKLESSIFFINHSKISELNKIIKLKKTVNLEIGFGEGLNIFQQSMKNKDNIFFGCDPYIKGSLNLKKEVEKNKMQNLFFSNLTFNEILVEKTKFFFETVTILFPDPWPKKKHFKRRLINVNFFNKLRSFLKKNAKIHIASDSKSYIAEILIIINEIKKEYKWVNQNKSEWDYLNMTLPQTKYFQKALKKGLNPIYFKLVKY